MAGTTGAPYGAVMVATSNVATVEGPAPSVVFRDGALPPPESPARRRRIRVIALLALAISAIYLTWRFVDTIALDWWWVAIPLFVVEIHNALGLVLFTIALWDLDSTAPPTGRRLTSQRVAILIPTYNEPREVLLPTISAAVALKPAHETWVLDDGRRDEVRELAEALGARYLTRPDNRHAKAGNLNHALKVVDADIVGVLDADHVPTARFLTALLPYFRDPNLAFVQSPQDFYNMESFEHERQRDGRVFNEEAVFYRVIAPAKNRWSAPFWCGTCALIRVDALRSVGGVSTDSVTEDIHTTLRMYRMNWSGAYHNEVLARGLAPDDANGYLIQRNRWAVGAMQVLRRENPILGPGLTVAQRIAFMTTLFGWFDSWRTLAYIAIPVIVVATGAVPIDAPGEIFAPVFLLTLGSQLVAMRALSRGHYPPVLSLLFDLVRLPAVLPATFALLSPRRSAEFRVTPKGRAGDGRSRTSVPRLLSVLAAGCAAGLAWFTATLFGFTPVTYGTPWAAIGAAFFVALNLALLIGAIGRIRAFRFAGNRRAATRLPVHVPVRLAGQDGDLLDLSVTGARVRVPEPVDDSVGELWLELSLAGGIVELEVGVRRTRIVDGHAEIGVVFADGQEAAVARLAVGIFHHEVKPGRRRRSRKADVLWTGDAPADAAVA